jgi:hypothetical protein
MPGDGILLRTFELAVRELEAEGFLEASGGIVGLKN